VRPLRLTVAAVGAVLLTGCVQTGSLAGRELACRAGGDGEPANGVVLMAQAVETAAWVPCLDTVPLGWHLSDVQVRDGSGRFWLDSNRGGDRAIEVALTPACRTGKATEIPSDRDGVRRLEQVSEVTPGYRGTRFYVFDGGCLTVHFQIAGDNRAEPLAVATEGIDLLRRTDVEQHVNEQTDGRLQLDPVPAEGGRR
jgi:hypothetical protein